MNFDPKWLQLPNAKMGSSITPPYLPNLLTLTCNPQGALGLLQGGRVSELIIEELFDKHDMIAYWATAIASSAESGIKLQRLTVSGVKVAIIRLLERLDHLLPKLLFLRVFAVDYNAARVRSTPQLLSIKEGSILTPILLLYRNGISWINPYQSSIALRFLNFSLSRRTRGIRAHL